MCNKNCRCIDCKNNQEFNKRHEPKKLSIEFIRVEVKEANLTVKEGKILFVRTEAIKHSSNQMPKVISNEENEGKNISNINKFNQNSNVMYISKKFSEDTSKLESNSKGSNSSNNYINSKKNKEEEKNNYLQKKRISNFNPKIIQNQAEDEDVENKKYNNNTELRLNDK